jgi:hypothetical protein
MKYLEYFAVAFYIAIAMFSLYYGYRAHNHEPRLMCGVAEISPDFSEADRQKCRMIRGHKL